MGKGLEGKLDEKLLRALDLFSLEKGGLRGDLNAIFSLLMRGRYQSLHSRDQGQSLRKQHEAESGRFSLDIRKFFTQRVILELELAP